jgi:hypothetical protein
VQRWPLARQVEAELLLSDIVPMFTHLASDEQDSVRILAAENCSSLAALLPEEESTTHVVPIVCKFGEDKSWRVRYMVRYNCRSLIADKIKGSLTVGVAAGCGATLPGSVDHKIEEHRMLVLY